MIVPLYQPQGSSSHLLAKAYGDSIGEKATHTGTLDPMAEGVLIVLTGEDRYLKGELSDWHKHYQFEILWGVSTDSLDLLGLVTKIKEFFVEEITERLQLELNDLVGEYHQKMPKFSAKRMLGKSAFDLAKEGIEVEQSFNEVELYSARVLGHKEVDGEELADVIEQKVDKVQGDFRQEDVIKGWQKIMKGKYFISTVEIETSKRFYVRALVRDLSKKLEIPATTFSIVRTQNGGYSIAECQRFNP